MQIKTKQKKNKQTNKQTNKQKKSNKKKKQKKTTNKQKPVIHVIASGNMDILLCSLKMRPQNFLVIKYVYTMFGALSRYPSI